MSSRKEDGMGLQEWLDEHGRQLARRTGVVRLLRGLRLRGEQLLHPIHRRRALRRLRERGPFGSVVFVCHGNIYRSPYAEYLFRKLLHADVAETLQVSSAGFVGPGRSSPEAAMTLASSRGIDLGAHRSSRITADRIHADTLVVVMETRQERMIRGITPRGEVLVLGDLDPQPAPRTIQDPWSESDDVLRSTYDRVERCVRVLVDVLSGSWRSVSQRVRFPAPGRLEGRRVGDSA